MTRNVETIDSLPKQDIWGSGSRLQSGNTLQPYSLHGEAGFMASGRFPGLGVQRFTPQRLSTAFPPVYTGSGIIETGSPITVAGPRRIRTDFPFPPWMGTSSTVRASWYRRPIVLSSTTLTTSVVPRWLRWTPSGQAAGQTLDCCQSADGYSSPSSAYTYSPRVGSPRLHAGAPDTASGSA